MMIVSNKNSDLKYSKKNSTNNSRKFINWPFNNFPAACMCGGLLASWRHWNSHWGVKYHPNKQSIICSAPMVWFLHRKGSQYIYERHSLSVHTFFKQNVSSLFFSNKIQPIVSTSNDNNQHKPEWNNVCSKLVMEYYIHTVHLMTFGHESVGLDTH